MPSSSAWVPERDAMSPSSEEGSTWSHDVSESGSLGASSEGEGPGRESAVSNKVEKVGRVLVEGRTIKMVRCQSKEDRTARSTERKSKTITHEFSSIFNFTHALAASSSRSLNL